METMCNLLSLTHVAEEDAVARDDVICWVFGELSGEATPIGVAMDAMSWTTIGMAGEVMSRELFSTPLVRPHGSSPRSGLRGEVGEYLPSSSQDTARIQYGLSSEQA